MIAARSLDIPPTTTGPIEARKPGLARCAPNREANRGHVVTVLREWVSRRRVSQRDLADLFEVKKPEVERVLKAEGPLWVEAILNLPDSDALDLLDGIREIVRSRRSGR